MRPTGCSVGFAKAKAYYAKVNDKLTKLIQKTIRK